MANSSRKILHGVRFEGKTYAPGMEDELAGVLPSNEAERLVARGHLEGAWAPTVPLIADPVATEPAKDQDQPKAAKPDTEKKMKKEKE